MTKAEKSFACRTFFDELAVLLGETHKTIASCNNDISAYLIPNGTEEQVSYYGKPANSFRVSDHWNWYANLNKCSDPHYIQCLSVDVPWPLKRNDIGKASDPRFAIQVSYYGEDKKYHCVFGESYNRKTKRWEWIDQPVDKVVAMMKGERE